ncbi:MAG: AAA family ATPase [Clostridiales bacterium]|nr:AAA family ATPase [Clostridiales bacterium]
MRLIRCHIENFGRLHDVNLEFDRGCHVIREQNGWGKSTLAAFIRVMFFGFEGENKRKNIENERKRFLPWQGGGYGGSLTFETGGSVYTVTRIFADKKINDSFELRDAQTNLISTEFSENLGEELFLINSESFQRTVFIGQNDCVTGTTDGINARLGNITDNMNDLDCYEKAAGALQEVLNRLNPRRKTGEIYRKNERVTKLQTEVSQNASLEETIQQYEGLAGQERERLENLRAQQEEIFALQRQASRARDFQTKRVAYDQLCADCEEKEAAYRQAGAVFPGEIPTEEELRFYLAVCDGMDRAAEGARICRLTEEEQEQIRELRAEQERESSETRSPYGEEMEDEADSVAKFQSQRNETGTVAKSQSLWNETGTVAKSQSQRNETGTVTKFQPQRNETDTVTKTQSLQNDTDSETVTGFAANRGNYGQIAAGALFLIAGIAFLFLNGNSDRVFLILAVILAAVGVLLLIAGVITGQHRAREEQIRREEQFHREETRRRARQAEEERRRWEEEQRRAAEEERRRWEAKRLAEERAQRQKQLESLEKKNKDCQIYREQYEKKRSELALAFQKLAFPYPENPREQLQLIWQQRIRWQHAKQEMEAARLKKREFEAQNEKTLLTVNEAEKPLPALEELNRQQQELEREADSVRKQLDIYGTQLDSLREKYDNWMETKELLTGEQEEVKALRQQYRQVQKAQEYLTKAKETLTARYMEPLMHSFSRYYQVIVGTSGTAADRYHMDANTQITVEEEGMQRETAYLSRGYQDLIGLCLRLALVDAMYQTERPFLVLDDPFVNLDAEKTAGGMRLLEEVASRYQVIYFTAK